jgi:eukaryotic-like serine/threonine-protein kinase
MALPVGTKLEAYEILSLLGAGGMGEVYRARDVVLKREVAIKVLPSFVSRETDRLQRFEQEARAAAALDHPNILAVHQFGTFEGSPYLVMELLEGRTLREELRHGPLPLRKVIDAGVQIVRGLAAAHEKGIVHRDLKPENIFVTKDGRIKILDFGLAKLTPSFAGFDDGDRTATLGTDPGVVMGTVGYMSPEQVRGEPADHRTDIFSFGAILYEITSGKQAFERPTPAEKMAAILNEDPSAISQIEGSTTPELLRVVRRCLEKHPEQRFQSASDLAFALEALPVSGSGPAIADDRGSRSRLGWKAGWAAASAMVLLAALGIAWWHIPPAVPIVESVSQLTDDGEAKRGGLVSDGSRIYVNEGPVGRFKIAQVSVAGGATAMVPTRLENPGIVGVAENGSALFALVGGFLSPGRPLWSIPLPAGEPRRLGSFTAQDAAVFPDGRIVFTSGTDLLVAGKGGENVRKLVSLPGNVFSPNVSPDGQWIVVTFYSDDTSSLAEVRADGTGLRTIIRGGDVCCGVWTADGRYLLYLKPFGRREDIWALPMQTGLLHRSRTPTQLTVGPLSYSPPIPSGYGKQILAMGAKGRGELVHFDMKLHQFLPFLSGISATDPTFSRDGMWVAYTSFPDNVLWRSRSDGTERMQLTYPPMIAFFPFINPDGTKISFTTQDRQISVIDMNGGQPQLTTGKNFIGGNWSPDGNSLVITVPTIAKHAGEKNSYELQLMDLTTGKVSVVPSSNGLLGGLWVTQDALVAATQDTAKLVTFDFRTQKWTDLFIGSVINWNLSPDRNYLYFSTGGPDPKAFRIRFTDHRVEAITSTKDIHQVVNAYGTQINVAPDGSPVFTRDIGSEEVYALNVRWPR